MRVLLTIPNEHWVHAQVMATALTMLLTDPRYAVTLDLPAQRPYENNQHHIVVKFLDGGYDAWLSIDADNPPLRNPLDLVELDLDVVGLPTPIWHWTGKPGERPIYWNGYDWDATAGAYREHPTREGLQEVDAVGTGCFLVARRVFEKPDLQEGAFVRELYPDGRVKFGNDLSFCRRVKAAGFRIWCHYGYPCRHVQEVDLHDVALAMKGLQHGG
jgi:hypothetical protein